LIAEITIKRIDDSDKTLRISKYNSRKKVSAVKTIGHKIGCNHKTIRLELDDYESVSFVAMNRI